MLRPGARLVRLRTKLPPSLSKAGIHILAARAADRVLGFPTDKSAWGGSRVNGPRGVTFEVPLPEAHVACRLSAYTGSFRAKRVLHKGAFLRPTGNADCPRFSEPTGPLAAATTTVSPGCSFANHPQTPISGEARHAERSGLEQWPDRACEGRCRRGRCRPKARACTRPLLRRRRRLPLSRGG